MSLQWLNALEFPLLLYQIPILKQFGLMNLAPCLNKRKRARRHSADDLTGVCFNGRFIITIFCMKIMIPKGGKLSACLQRLFPCTHPRGGVAFIVALGIDATGANTFLASGKARRKTMKFVWSC